jgi:putative transposase
MTKSTIALSELTETGADADLLKHMIQFVAPRMMNRMSSRGVAPASESRARSATTAATATGIV